MPILNSASLDSAKQVILNNLSEKEEIEILLLKIKNTDVGHSIDTTNQEYIDRLISLSEKYTGERVSNLLLFELGKHFMSLKNEVEGMDYLFSSLAASESIKDSVLMSSITYSIASNFYWKKEYDDALKYFQMGIAITPNGKASKLRRARNNMGVGATFLELGDLQKSKKYHLEALRLNTEVEDWPMILTSLNNIASLNIYLKDTIRAVHVFEDVIHKSDSLSIWETKAFAHYMLGEIQFMYQDYESARISLETAVNKWERENFTNDLIQSYPLLARIYTKIDQHGKANDVLGKYIDLSEQMYSIEKLTSRKELEAKYQNKKKALENTHLKKTNQLIQGRNNIYAFIVLILFALLFVIISLYSQNRNSKNKLIHQNATISNQNHELQELQRYKARFFSNIAHEIRSPLTLIIGPLQQISNMTLANEIKPKIELIKSQAGKMLGLANQLLDVHKIENNKMKVHQERIDLRQYFRNQIQSYTDFANNKNIILSFQFLIEGNTIVIMDQEKMTKIFDNLLNNALKFSPKHASISIVVSPIADGFKLKVRDNGQGIHPDAVPKIFDRFYQSLEENKVNDRLGSGIGLSLSKDLVKLMSGRIWVESELGKGSSFFVALPVTFIDEV